jgi:hypothetical protein
MVVLHALILWQTRDSILRGYGDFASFYTAGKILKAGESKDLYEPKVQWRIQQEFAAGVDIRKGPLPYIRPPFHALLFLPFAYLSYANAYKAWTAINVLIALVILFLLRPPGGRFFPVSFDVLLCLGFFPVAFNLLQGQDAILLFLVLALALRALQNGSEAVCGCLLALGLFKFHLVVPIAAVFLLRRKFAIVLAFISTALTLFLLSVALVGWKAVIAYPKYLWDLSQAPALAGMKPRSMPNLRGLITDLAGNAYAAHMNWLFALIVVLGIVVMAIVWRMDNNPRLLAGGFSFSVVITLVTSYYANSYDMTSLLLPVLLLGGLFFEENDIPAMERTTFIACVAILFFSPLYWVLALRFDQFSWVAVVLFVLGLSLARTLRAWQSHWVPSV